jgi:MATE family multidrug resistance protein
MIIALIGALLNIVLDIILVYGIEGYISPLNIEGAAYASIIAQIVMAILSAILLIRKTEIPLKITFPFNKEIKRFLIMIANLFIRTISLNVALYFASAFATSYGKQYIAAYTIAINIWFLGAFVIDGYASAGNILSGKLLGSKQYDVLLKLGNKLIKYGIIIGVFMMLFGSLIYYPIGKLFTKDPEVLKAFYAVFWVVLIMQPLCALAFIYDGIFKGLGKMKFLRNVLLFSTFIVFVPVLFILDYFDYKLYAIFAAFTFWIAARGIPLIVKFRKMFIPLIQKM